MTGERLLCFFNSLPHAFQLIVFLLVNLFVTVLVTGPLAGYDEFHSACRVFTMHGKLLGDSRSLMHCLAIWPPFIALCPSTLCCHSLLPIFYVVALASSVCFIVPAFTPSFCLLLPVAFFFADGGKLECIFLGFGRPAHCISYLRWHFPLHNTVILLRHIFITAVSKIIEQVV